MNTLEEYFRSLHKIQEPFNALDGLSSLIAKIPFQESQNSLNSNFFGLTSVSKLISQQFAKPKTASELLFSSSLSEKLNHLTYKNNFNSINSLTNSLNLISNFNPNISESLSKLTMNQLYISSNLSKISENLIYRKSNDFNTFNFILNSKTTDYLRDIVFEEEYDDISIAEHTSKIIADATESIAEVEFITLQLFDEFKTKLLSELSILKENTKKEKARTFIFELIAIVSLLLTIYSIVIASNDLSNRETNNETKIQFEKLKSEIISTIEHNNKKNNIKRTALINTKLQLSEKKNSQITSIVTKGQEVYVIEIRKKMILVSYIDKSTNEPKSGFVFKKHFKFVN